MLLNYFDYIFVHLRQKVRLRPELNQKFLSTLGPNPAQTRPEKADPTYNSGLNVYADQPGEDLRTAPPQNDAIRWSSG